MYRSRLSLLLIVETQLAQPSSSPSGNLDGSLRHQITRPRSKNQVGAETSSSPSQEWLFISVTLFEFTGGMKIF
ncbi:hypothetical protein EDD22DRAFT_886002 [Suillus occidentalis]|nr:hypothetical protein EDD22DRAFT_886002 [Suillus occidentalis]